MWNENGIGRILYEGVCLAICIGAFWTDSIILWGLWLGGLVGCTLHFVVHIGQSVVVRQYIPSVATSLICLPISVWLISRSVPELLEKTAIEMLHISTIASGWSVLGVSVSVEKVVLGGLTVIGMVIVAVNIRFAQKMIGWFTKHVEASLRNV